jgi:asparagine synthase (glutamine-hydrolysing)
MCGLAGIFAYQPKAAPVQQAELLRIRDHMLARGPDGEGLWLGDDARIGLAHRRLAIIDLTEDGAQPMASADGRFRIVFNGEIYNYRELRIQLQREGVVFRSQSDTEVLLQLYARHGKDMLEKLRGMFAFAIWDTTESTLFLARDAFGIKPLYYANDGATFRFASQVKALLAGGAISSRADPAGILGFHLWGSVPEPFTTYAGIKSLPAGTVMKVRSVEGIEAAKPYVSLVSEISQDRYGHIIQSELADIVRAAARDSVAAHLQADVEVGLFLSAGIDSGALLGLIKDAGVDHVHAITLGFDSFAGTGDDEVPLAAEVARRYGAKHTVRRVGQSEFEADLPALLGAMDQPSIDGVNTWFVSKAAREAGLKVALSGLGADEMLAGYPGFNQIPRMVRTIRPLQGIPGISGIARHLLGTVGRLLERPKLAGLVDYGGTLPGAYFLRRSLFLPTEMQAMFDPEFVATGLSQLDTLDGLAASLVPDPSSDVGRVAALELSAYTRNQLLRDADWAGMAQSMEIRTPFLDIRFLQAVAPVMPAIREAAGKRALAAAPLLALPQAVTNRTKSGFAVPMATWMADAADAAVRKSGAVPVHRKGLASRNWARYVWFAQTGSGGAGEAPQHHPDGA